MLWFVAQFTLIILDWCSGNNVHMEDVIEKIAVPKQASNLVDLHQSTSYKNHFHNFHETTVKADRKRLKRFSCSEQCKSIVSEIETESVSSDTYDGVRHLGDNCNPCFLECDSYKPMLREEQPFGTPVLRVIAIDLNPRQTIEYSLVTTPGERARFRIDKSTGDITTAHIFDRDEPIREKEIYITVRATDNGRPRLDDVCTFKVTMTFSSVLERDGNPDRRLMVCYARGLGVAHREYSSIFNRCNDQQHQKISYNPSSFIALLAGAWNDAKEISNRSVSHFFRFSDFSDSRSCPLCLGRPAVLHRSNITGKKHALRPLHHASSNV